MKDIPIICCPKCGQQYLPSEIFMPDEFFGKQREIFKSIEGQIEFYDGEDPNLEEYYICDNCNTKLKIEAKLAFKVEEANDNFEEEYISKINKPEKIKLSEEELF